MTFESRKGDDANSKNIIQYATSDNNGDTWSARADLFKPTDATKEAASPYIVNVNNNLVRAPPSLRKCSS